MITSHVYEGKQLSGSSTGFSAIRFPALNMFFRSVAKSIILLKQALRYATEYIHYQEKAV